MIKKILKEKSAIFCKINFNLHLHFGQFLMNYLVYMLLLHLFWKLWPWWFERNIVHLCTYNGFDMIFKKPSSIFYWTVFRFDIHRFENAICWKKVPHQLTTLLYFRRICLGRYVIISNPFSILHFSLNSKCCKIHFYYL